MGFYLTYSTMGGLKDKVDAFIRETKFEKINEEWKENKKWEIKSKGKISNIIVETQWEIEPYEDFRSLRIKLKPEKRIQIRAFLKFILLLFLLPTLPIMFTRYWHADNVFVFILAKIPIVLSIILLFLHLNDSKKSRLIKQLELRFIESLPPSEIRIKSPGGIALMPSGVYLAFFLLLCIGVQISLYRIPVLFYLVLPFTVLTLLNISIYLLSLKEIYFVWKTLITGTLTGWIIVQMAIIIFVLIMYSFNLFIFVRYDEATGRKQITFKKAFSTLYYKPVLVLNDSDPIKSRIQMIADIGEKNYYKSDMKRNERIRNFYIRFHYLYYGTVGLILILLSIWIAIFYSKFLRKIPDRWRTFMATNVQVSIMPPSLKVKSNFRHILFLITLIMWTLVSLPINYIFFVFSFDMVFYIFTNNTLIFSELSILYSCVPMTFMLYGKVFNLSRAALILSKMVLLFFSFPFLYFSLRWLSNIFMRLSRRAHEYFRGVDVENVFSSNFMKRISEISRTYQLTVPKMRIVNQKGVFIYTRISVLSRRATVIINKNILDRINEKELEAIIAHELGHIKQGLKKIVLLKIISRIALFPNYLLTLLLNSREMEILADKFAIESCKDKESLKSALIKLSALSMAEKIRLPERRKRPKTKLPKRIRMWKDKLLILDDFLFSRSLIGYSYPEIRERLKEIEKA